jgi:hypothetical protein
MNYFTDPSPFFGRYAWTFFALQILIALAGAYMAFSYRDRVQFRETLFRNLGRALLVVGGIGILIAALRLFNVPVLHQRLWFYVQLVVELGLAGYVYYYFRNVYPQQLAQAKQAPRRGSPGRQLASQGAGTPTPVAPPEPRPEPITRRGEARRERKRRSK